MNHEMFLHVYRTYFLGLLCGVMVESCNGQRLKLSPTSREALLPMPDLLLTLNLALPGYVVTELCSSAQISNLISQLIFKNVILVHCLRISSATAEDFVEIFGKATLD